MSVLLGKSILRVVAILTKLLLLISHHIHCEYCFIGLFSVVDIQSNVRVHNSENENEIQNTFGLSHDCEQGVFTCFCN